MSDEAPPLPKSSRDPVDRITDSMLIRPLNTWTPAEWGMFRRALAGPRSEEFRARIETLHRIRHDLPDAPERISEDVL